MPHCCMPAHHMCSILDYFYNEMQNVVLRHQLGSSVAATNPAALVWWRLPQTPWLWCWRHHQWCWVPHHPPWLHVISFHCIAFHCCIWLLHNIVLRPIWHPCWGVVLAWVGWVRHFHGLWVHWKCQLWFLWVAATMTSCGWSIVSAWSISLQHQVCQADQLWHPVCWVWLAFTHFDCHWLCQGC